MTIQPLPPPQDFLILVVDDLSQNLKVVGNILNQAGYATTFAQSGAKALERIKEAHPHLVLLDLMMPKIDGFKLCEQIKCDPAYADLPIIFLTASHEREHILQAFEAGAVDYITKPFNPPELLARIHTHLELQYNRQQLRQLVKTVQHLNADLEQKVEDRTQKLRQAVVFEETLKRITEKIRDSLDENQIIQTAIQELTQALHIDGCNAGLYDLEVGTSIVTYEHTPFLPPQVGMVYHFDEYYELYSQLLSGNSTQFCWHPVYFREMCEVDLDYTKTSVFICPIQDDQGILGDMWLYKRSQEVFEGHEVRLIQHVATQCAIALRQARLYDKAQTQVQELERLNHLKNDFLSTISHELRTPMASIEMMATLLSDLLARVNLEDVDRQQAEKYIAILQNDCQQELSLINDLLDLVRLDAETEPLVMEPIDLKHFIPHLAEPFVHRAAHQSQTLDIVLPDELPIVQSDASILKRMMTELLTNACKYTPEGGAIRVYGQHLGDRLIISIANSGVDLSPDELTRMFDTFYRIPNNDPWKHGGTGLGLALVKKQIQYLGGTVQVCSQNHTFTITLHLPLIDSRHDQSSILYPCCPISNNHCIVARSPKHSRSQPFWWGGEAAPPKCPNQDA